MSSALGLAAVTWVLKDLLNEGLINSQVADTVSSGNVRVTTLPPLRELEGTQPEQPQLNLFLYHLSPNLGWRNAGLPAFDSRGTRTSQPPLALDLHYLLTAYAQEPLHAEVLLGYAMQLLHETAVLTRGALVVSLQHNLESAHLPGSLQQLTQSGLADQIEAIKITPQAVSADEMSKLWTGFQAPYRPSVAYLVTTVLIESAKPSRPALPVLRVGSDARGPLVGVSPAPTLLAVRAPNYQLAARPTDPIHLFGQHLAGEEAVVVLRHARLNLEFQIPVGRDDFTPAPTREALRDGSETFDLPEDVRALTETRVRANLDLAVPPEQRAAGLFTVQLRVRRPGETSFRSSNVLPLAIAPAITAGIATREAALATLSVTCNPPVHQGQTVSLIVAGHELPGRPEFADARRPTTNLVFNGELPESLFPRSGSITHPARLRVDGVDGIFISRSGPTAPPEFASTETIEFS
jgi:hypothetical protein